MKFFNWKVFSLTAFVCLLTILPGVMLWDRLPETMAIHFNIYGEADNFASRSFVVFGIPLLMVALQAICCFINDINAYKYGERKKFETVTKWIIPFLTVSLQAITLYVGLGKELNVIKAVSCIVGCVFLVIGNYLPKFDRIKNYDVESEKARRINRFIGYLTVIMGVVFLISALLPQRYTIVSLLLLIPYAIISICYGIKVGCEKTDK